MSAIAREKKQVKCRASGQESVIISVIAGVCFSHFFMCFAGGMALVRIRGVSVIARCPQGESRLYVQEIQASLLKKMLNVRYCLNCLTRDVQ